MASRCLSTPSRSAARLEAARVQKARQDRLGLGWANHDHHTFRCSRRFFPRIIGMFTRLGFQLRERFHAGFLFRVRVVRTDDARDEILVQGTFLGPSR